MAQTEPKPDSENWHSLNRNRWHYLTEKGGANRTVLSKMAEKLQQGATPFFLAIAFAASADFITPIGYQTNLMVMGPGNYAFKDYSRIGLPLTFIYSIIVLIFLTQFYL